MYDECYVPDTYDEDDRDLEHDQDRAEAEGKFHQVAVRVTVQATVTIRGSDHDTDELVEHLEDVRENGEIVDWDWDEV